MTYSASQAQAGRGSTLAIGPTESITGSTTSDSTTVSSASSTAGITVGMWIAGTGIPGGATVTAIGSGTLTISANATATGSDVALTVGPTLIGELIDVPFKRGDWQFDDTTNLESGSDKEVLATIRDNGTVQCKGNRISADAGQGAVETAYDGGSLTAFTITLPKTAAQTDNGDKYAFNAYVKTASFTINPTKKIDFEMDLMISGAITYTAGS